MALGRLERQTLLALFKALLMHSSSPWKMTRPLSAAAEVLEATASRAEDCGATSASDAPAKPSTSTLPHKLKQIVSKTAANQPQDRWEILLEKQKAAKEEGQTVAVPVRHNGGHSLEARGYEQGDLREETFLRRAFVIWLLLLV
eukprot:TRINITY_DN28181_c0_g1_i2.p1 TRINITY_DN28181_c0_g1~~TRINITY_DN28181_c0_g1_i2.p1  ORF type:complete len:144 (+),score=33.22 TRINITY_DN28181_c0_g1_i2:121-552(+)